MRCLLRGMGTVRREFIRQRPQQNEATSEDICYVNVSNLPK